LKVPAYLKKLGFFIFNRVTPFFKSGRKGNINYLIPPNYFFK